MKPTTTRRFAAVAATALAAGMLTSGPAAQADTSSIEYSCTVSNFPLKFSFVQGTNAPTSLYVGKSFTPTYTAKTSFDAGLIAFARTFGADSFEGAVAATVVVDGTATTVQAPIPRTKVPSSGPLVLTATGPLATIAAAAVGRKTYKPGNIGFTVTAYRADGSELFSTGDQPAECNMPANTQNIDVVSFVKSPSRTAATAAYAKAAKKVTATAKVTSTSGVAPTGKVTFALFKGRKKIKSVAANVVGGKAAASFARVKAKGSYKVVSTYSGSTAVNGSSATKAFKVK